MRQAEESPASARLQQLQELTDFIGKEVHHLALELRPTALDDLGLHKTLLNYVEQWSERSGVEADFHSIDLDGARLPSAIETALYRIVQEGLTNVLKHAQARRISLILQRSPNQVLAILEDDGRGFDAEAVVNSAGAAGRLGLRGHAGARGAGRWDADGRIHAQQWRYALRPHSPVGERRDGWP